MYFFARILAVELRDLKHWDGRKIAFETNGNQLEAKQLLRHRSVDSTMKYIGKIVFKTDDFDTTSASTLKDKLRPGCLGWIEYSIAYLRQGIHCFKKPNRFMDMFEKVEGYKQKFKVIHVNEILNGIVVHAVRGKQSE